MPTTTSTTAAPSTASVTSAAATTLLNSLDTGSGVDTTSLVTSLVEAQFAARSAALKSKYDTLTSQISQVGTLKGTITDFTNALEQLVKGGTLSSQPVSSNTGVLSATALSGAKLAGKSASVTVSQLAAAQTAVSTTAFASSSTVVGTGTLTLKLGTATYNSDGTMASLTGSDADGDGAEDSISIDITDANSSLSGIAAAINAKKAGVTASVVTDADGTAYLSLKGATGAAKAFSLTAASSTGDLSQIAVGPGASAMTVTSQAQNAKLKVDGVAVERASNEISDLVDGMKLTLTGTSTIPVSLTASTPTTALSAAVNDLVDTYNQVFAAVKAQADPITGVLRSDSATQNLLRSMKALSTKQLLPATTDGSPTTLAELGVRTNRDGTLQVDDNTLASVLAKNPDGVEAIFAFSSTSSNGVYAAMNSLQLAATSTLYGLGASATTYTAAQSAITEQQDKITDQSTALNTRLTQQFASMNAKVAAYKSTQTFLKNQIDAWTYANK